MWRGKKWRQVRSIVEGAFTIELFPFLNISHTFLPFVAGELACVQLLICQTAPVLRKMQSSVSSRVEGKLPEESRSEDPIEDTFMKHWPSIQELRDHGHECEKRYQSCDLNTIAWDYYYNYMWPRWLEEEEGEDNDEAVIIIKTSIVSL